MLTKRNAFDATNYTTIQTPLSPNDDFFTFIHSLIISWNEWSPEKCIFRETITIYNITVDQRRANVSPNLLVLKVSQKMVSESCTFPSKSSGGMLTFIVGDERNMWRRGSAVPREGREGGSPAEGWLSDPGSVFR